MSHHATAHTVADRHSTPGLILWQMRKAEAIYQEVPVERRALAKTSEELNARMKQTEADIVRLKRELEVEKVVYR